MVVLLVAATFMVFIGIGMLREHLAKRNASRVVIKKALLSNPVLPQVKT